MAANVRWVYGGNLTGLFFTGSEVRLPAELQAEPTWRVSEPLGYDGQYYHLLAHDPLLRHPWTGYLDNPRLRWRRIGVPAAAAVLGSVAGDVHLSYLAVQFGFVFAGALWLARYSGDARYGLAFLLIPATLVSIDRMTVDLALAALVVGFVHWRGRGWPVFAILCAAPLVRETGLILPAVCALYSLTIERSWRRAAAGAACTLPALAWFGYVHLRTPADGTTWLAQYPFAGLVGRLTAGDAILPTTVWLRAAHLMENLAFAGICLAFVLAGVALWRQPRGLPQLTAALFAIFASILGKADLWDTAYAAGRTMSPLLTLLLMIGIAERRWVYAMPVLLILPRIALQFEAQIAAALRG